MTSTRSRKKQNTTNVETQIKENEAMSNFVPADCEDLSEEDLDTRARRHCGLHSRILSQLRQVQPPTESDEELIERVQNGDTDASELLFHKHYKYILEKIIDATRGNWYSDDILQAGAIGLFEAAKRFDSTKHNKFLTYAHYWILKYIYIEMRNELLPLGGIAIGRDAKERLFNYIKCVLQGMSDEEIMAKLKIGKKALTELKILNMSAARVKNIDGYDNSNTNDSDDKEQSYIFSKVPNSASVEDSYITQELFNYVEQKIAELSVSEPMMAKVLEYELGLNGKDQLTKAETCVELGITKKMYDNLKREGNKYLRSNMIADDWYDGKREILEEEVQKCVKSVGKQLQ